MNTLKNKTRSQSLDSHVRATGKSCFTASELADILEAPSMAATIQAIDELVAEGNLLQRAQYVAMDGSLWAMDEASYATALRENGFENPMTGEWVEGCVELAPFWAYPSAA